MKKLSIIIPLYNEEKTILEVLNSIKTVPLSLEKETIIINDGSTDSSKSIVEEFIKKNKELKIKLINKKNEGKGSAVKEGIKHSTGDIVIIQDADLEYDQKDHQRCIDPIIKGKYSVIYGSRRLEKSNKQISSLSFFLGGNLLTLATNFLYNSKLTDEATCYKTFKASIIKSIEIKGNKFDWEPEVTAKILKKGIKIGEVPIKYYPRLKKEGKKISWKDGIEAVWVLIKYKFI